MAVGDKSELEPRPRIWQQLKDAFGKYGLIALFLTAFTLLNAYIQNNATRAIERADKQAEANYRIGNLEGKMELLLNKDLLIGSPTATSTSTSSSKLK